MNVDAILNHNFPMISQAYTAVDCSRYALSVGFGFDPTDERQLSYAFGPPTRAAGSMALVLGTPGFWLDQPWASADWTRVLHGQQSFRLHAPLPVEGKVSSRLRILKVIDKRERGAYIVNERDVVEEATGNLLATLSGVSICRGDGGFGGQDEPIPLVRSRPTRDEDYRCTIPTIPQAALLYDLNGIVNPVHSWPPAARKAGYPRPFLHGTCTMGFVHHALVRTVADYDSSRIAAMSMRFVKEFYPGEALRVNIWVDGSALTYEAWAEERGATVAIGEAELVK